MFLPFIPLLAACALLALGLNLGLTTAERVGLFCCETVVGGADSKDTPSLPEHTDGCDCAQHLHSLLGAVEPVLATAAHQVSAQSFVPLVCLVPDNLLREINQPPRIS